MCRKSAQASLRFCSCAWWGIRRVFIMLASMQVVRRRSRSGRLSECAGGRRGMWICADMNGPRVWKTGGNPNQQPGRFRGRINAETFARRGWALGQALLFARGAADFVAIVQHGCGKPTAAKGRLLRRRGGWIVSGQAADRRPLFYRTARGAGGPGFVGPNQVVRRKPRLEQLGLEV